MAQRRHAEAALRTALPPHHQATDRGQQDQQARQQHQQLVGQAEHLALVQHGATLHRPRHQAVVGPADVRQHLAAVLVQVQGGVMARVIGEQGHGEHALVVGREADAVARLYSQAAGGVDDLLQADARGRSRRGGSLAVVRGMRVGLRQRGVLHRPGHSLPGGRIEAACLQVRLRHRIPHGRREMVPGPGELRAPEAGPGHAGKQHEQQHGAAPEPGDRMQVAPQQATTGIQARPQHASTTLTARPPEVQAGHHQHHAPAGGQLDQAVADSADQQLAVQGAGESLQVVRRVLLAEQRAAVGVEEQVGLASVELGDELRAALGRRRRQVLAHLSLRQRLLQARQLLVGGQRRTGRLHAEQLGIHQLVQLRLEQVDDARQRQQDHEGNDEQPGIEVPAPGQVVEGWLAHANTPQWSDREALRPLVEGSDEAVRWGARRRIVRDDRLAPDAGEHRGVQRGDDYGHSIQARQGGGQRRAGQQQGAVAALRPQGRIVRLRRVLRITAGHLAHPGRHGAGRHGLREQRRSQQQEHGQQGQARSAL